MNIWYIAAYDSPKGNSSRTYDYARALVDRGHRVTFFTSSFDHFSRRERLGSEEKFREEEIDGIKVVWLKTIPYQRSTAMRFANMLSNAWRSYVAGSHRQERPDVILGPSVPLFTGLAAYLLARKKECSFCFEVRDIWPQALVDLGVLSAASPITWILSRIERFLYRRSDRIVAVLPFAHRHIAKSGGEISKIAWIPNGVDLRRFKNIPPYDGGRADHLRAMYVGGFSTTHSVETILQAAKILQERGLMNFTFTIAGGGRQEDEFRTMEKALGLTTTQFVGMVQKDKIPELLASSDVLIASVRDTPVYQFGINSNKLFDYLAAGRPIIFAGSTPNDPVADAGAGVTIPPEEPLLMADALSQILRLEPAKRRQIGERGLAYAREHFDTSVLATQLERELLSAIADARKSRARAGDPLDATTAIDHPEPTTLI